MLLQLNLRSNRLTDRDMAQIAQMGFVGLRKLLLWKNNISVVGAKYIGRQIMPELQFLDIDENNLGDEGLTQLLKSNRLQTLQVSTNDICCTGLPAFLQETHATSNLIQLSLSQNFIGKRGAQLISKALWRKLLDLKINSCGIGDNGACHLSKSDFRTLKYLQIKDNYIGLDGCISLSRHGTNGYRYLAISEYKIQTNNKTQIEVIILFLYSICNFKASIEYPISNLNIQRKSKSLIKALKRY